MRAIHIHADTIQYGISENLFPEFSFRWTLCFYISISYLYGAVIKNFSHTKWNCGVEVRISSAKFWIAYPHRGSYLVNDAKLFEILSIGINDGIQEILWLVGCVMVFLTSARRIDGQTFLFNSSIGKLETFPMWFLHWKALTMYIASVLSDNFKYFDWKPFKLISIVIPDQFRGDYFKTVTGFILDWIQHFKYLFNIPFTTFP